MRSRRFRGDVAARILLLFGLASSGATAQFSISPNGLQLDGAGFRVRGVVYSNTAIGRMGSDAFRDSGCLYARDFPLIAAAGANVIETRARVEPADRAFRKTLESSGLYWLAGFPLELYHDRRSSLSPDTPGGRALRRRILEDFASWASSANAGGRVVAFVFGDGVARDYNQKFAGSPKDFYTLAAEAAGRLAEAGIETLVTTRVADAADIGDPTLATDDGAQSTLDFWSVDQTGRSALGSLFEALRNRTSKPILISGFGVDAYDQPSGSEDAVTQAEVLASLVGEIRFAERSQIYPALGGVYNGFVDEWFRGSLDPQVHGGGQAPGPGSPDGALNPGWLGLFGAVRTGVNGLDSLRPRRAYFELAKQWGGDVPPELSLPGRPITTPGGLLNSASGFPILGRGGLFSLAGSALAAVPRATPSAARLPLHLGTVSVCMSGEPAPLLFADSREIRGQIPWNVARGQTAAIVYRAGTAGNRATATVEGAAPGIFDRGVFRPGLPCPVDQFNGVRPGQVLEIYGTGLGAVVAAAASGEAPVEPTATAISPRALWRGRELEVLYAGLFPGVVGVYQTNVRVPSENIAATTGELRIEAGGFFSNPHPLRIVAEDEPERFGLDGPHPRRIVVQEGAPGRSAEVEVLGAGAFCGLVRFRVDGLPPGIDVSIPVGLPGQRLPLTVTAQPGSPRVENVPVRLTGFAAGLGEISRTFEITVLPGSGDIRLRIVSAGWLTGEPGAEFSLDGGRLFETVGGGPGRGFNLLTMDAATGTLGELRTFDTWGSDEDVAALENYLLGLPDGILVMAAIADDGFLRITDRTRRIIRETLGSERIDQLEYQWSWALLGRTGAERPVVERLGEGIVLEIDRVLSFPLPE